MGKVIPYGKQQITEDDISSVVETLRHDYLTQGPKVSEFEEEFAKYVGSKYAIAVSNGTAALHLSALALDIKPGDKVITSTITFAASANCVRYCGGEVVFADIDPDSYLISFDYVKDLLENNPKGTFKGIIPIDFAGLPVDTKKFRQLADEHDLWILEDACHAPGGSYLDNEHEVKCGDNKYSDLSIFSFHPVKHIATGEGGMITTNDHELYHKIKTLRTHGITKDPQEMDQNHGGWYYEMQELGFNYRLSDIQSALGLSQLNKANEGLQRRRDIAAKYDLAFQGLPIKKQKIPSNYSHAYHLYVIETDRRKELYDYLKSKNIYTQVHYIPVHLQPYYQSLGWKKGDFSNAEYYYERCLSLPMFPSLIDEEISHVISQIEKFFGV